MLPFCSTLCATSADSASRRFYFNSPRLVHRFEEAVDLYSQFRNRGDAEFAEVAQRIEWREELT